MFTLEVYFFIFIKKYMAKKGKKIEVVSEEVSVVNNDVINNEIDNNKINNIDEMTLENLIYVEKALNIVCKKYENTLKSYDGSILRNTIEYNRFKTLNDLHNKVISKMENELLILT